MVAAPLSLLDRVLARIECGGRIYTAPGTVVARTIEAHPVYDVLLEDRQIVKNMPRELLLAAEQESA